MKITHSNYKSFICDNEKEVDVHRFEKNNSLKTEINKKHSEKPLCPKRLHFQLIDSQYLLDLASPMKGFRFLLNSAFFFNNLCTVYSCISLLHRRSACEQKAEVGFEAKWTFIFEV